MPNTLTNSQIDDAIRAWARGSLQHEAAAEIIVGTNLRENVVPKYLTWDATGVMARPELRRLLEDDAVGSAYLSTTALVLARLAANLSHGPLPQTAELDLQRLWSLGAHSRQVVVKALATTLEAAL